MYPGFETKNIITKYVYNNSRGYVVPDAQTEQYKGSFFVRTISVVNVTDPLPSIDQVPICLWNIAFDRTLIDWPLWTKQFEESLKYIF